MLKQRLITAAILIPVVFYILFFASPWVFRFATVLIVVLAAWEWPSFMGKTSCWARIGYIVIMVFSLLVSQFLPLWFVLCSAVFTWLILTYWVLVYPAQQKKWDSLGRVALLGILVILPLYFVLNYLHNLPHANALLVILLLLIWGADSCAYFIGRAFGRQKLLPAVSPNKSWQGFYAAIASSFLVALAAIFWLNGMLASYWLGFLVLSIITTLASVIGDLAESMFKRAQGVKDSGNLLPGHGGILDRIDSLTAAAPIYTLGLVILGIN